MRTVGIGVVALLLGVGLVAADVSVAGGVVALAIGAALCAFGGYLGRRGVV